MAFSKWRPDLLMFRSRKLSSLKKMPYLKRQKMQQNLESSYSKVGRLIKQNFPFAKHLFSKQESLFTFFATKISATF